MRPLAIACLFVSSLTLASDPPREDATHQVGEIGSRVVAFVERAESGGFSGTVLVAKDGTVIAAVGVGWADLDGKIPNTPATLFEIASATKQFTSAAVMRLVQDGKLSLDDTIDRHLPEVPENCRKITVRHLLQHTSGIPGVNVHGSGDDVTKVLPEFLHGGPKHPPGTHWEYWNQGYSLLTEIIARASGKSYTEYCRTALFTPAQMSVTCFTGDKPPAKAIVAIGQSTLGAPRSALEHPYGSYGFQYRGMGGAVTSVWDLWRWDRALSGTAILNAESKVQLFKPGLDDYALGWWVRKNRRGRLLQHHGGSVRGFTCELRRYPEHDACVFVLSNRSYAPTVQVAQAVEEIAFNDPLTTKEPPAPLTADVAKALAGKYKDAKGATFIIEADGKVTRARIEWYNPGLVTRATLGLNSTGDVVLYEWTDATKLTVERDATGPAKSISISDRKFSRIE